MNGINDQYDENFDENALDLGSDGSVEPTEAPTEPPVEAEPEVADPSQSEPEPAPAQDHTASDASTAEEEPQQDERGAIYLPKKRFDEVVAQRNEALLERETLAEQVKLLQAMVRQTQGQPAQQQPNQQAPATQPDQTVERMRQLRRMYNQSLVDGDMDKADEVMEAMDYLRRQQIEREVVERATQNARSITADEADQREYYAKLGTYLDKYPAFDEKSPYFDSDLSAKAFNVGKVLIQSGMSRTQALEELASMFGPVAEQRVAALAPPKPAAPSPTAAPALNRAPAKTGTQPPAIHTTGGTGKAAPRYDTSSMTIEDFERLSPDEIAKILEAS